MTDEKGRTISPLKALTVGLGASGACALGVCCYVGAQDIVDKYRNGEREEWRRRVDMEADKLDYEATLQEKLRTAQQRYERAVNPPNIPAKGGREK